MAVYQYINEVCNRDNAQYSTLSLQQERELALRAKNDPIAKKEFVEHNLRLVITKMRREYSNRFNLNEDEKWELICEGNSALEKAVDKFQVRGTEEGVGYIKFSTFVYNWHLRSAMNKAVRKLRHIQIPENLLDLENKVYRVSEQYFAEQGIYPTDSQIAEIIGDKKITERHIKDIKNVYASTITVSANTPIGEGDIELSDLISGSDGRDDLEKTSLEQLREVLIKQIENLSDSERAVVIGFYFNQQQLPEISRVLNMSVATVDCNYRRALRKLKISISKEDTIMSEVRAQLNK
jgi:RNA polymerase sigma factor FliA